MVQKQQGKKDVLSKTKHKKVLLHVNSEFTNFFQQKLPQLLLFYGPFQRNFMYLHKISHNFQRN